MTTPNLGLTELANQQNQYLNANATFAIIDALLQTPVISMTLTAAPASPANGALYIMASAWAGVTGAAAGKLALYRTGSGWIVITPKEGWKFECAADEITYRYDGASWLPWAAGGSSAQQSIIAACSDELTPITAGAGKLSFRVPYAFNLTGVRASLRTAQTSGSVFTVDINADGTSILSTELTVDNGEKTSSTADVPAVISAAALADDAEITVDVDQVGDGTAAGLKVYLIGSPA